MADCPCRWEPAGWNALVNVQNRGSGWQEEVIKTTGCAQFLVSWSRNAGNWQIRFCAVPSAGFASCLSIRELTVTHFWGAVTMGSIRNSLRLCVVMLDCVLTFFCLVVHIVCSLFPTDQPFWQLIFLSSCTPSCTQSARPVHSSTCGSQASESLVSSQTNAGALISYWVRAVRAVGIETCMTKVRGLLLLGFSKSCGSKGRSCSFSIVEASSSSFSLIKNPLKSKCVAKNMLLWVQVPAGLYLHPQPFQLDTGMGVCRLGFLWVSVIDWLGCIFPVFPLSCFFFFLLSAQIIFLSMHKES